jgi:hypothetical protein
MEEIVVALRETTRVVDRVRPFAVTGQSRAKRIVRGINDPADAADLRDGEFERLLRENASLNARVVSLLKILEQQQTVHAESMVEQTAETTRIEADREVILHEVRMALEVELGPILLVVLRLLEKQRADPRAGNREAGRGGGSGPTPGPTQYPRPSGWLVDLMQGLEDNVPTPNDPTLNDRVTAADPMPHRSKLRELMAQVLNALSPEPNAVTPRRRYSPHEGPT